MLWTPHISLWIGTNGKPLTATGKFSNAIDNLMIGKTLATNGEEITYAMIGNGCIRNLLVIIGKLKHRIISNDWENIGTVN